MTAIYWTYDHHRPEWVAAHDMPIEELLAYFERKGAPAGEADDE